MKSVLLALGVIGALALIVALRRGRPEGDPEAPAVEALTPSIVRSDFARAEIVELDTSADRRDEVGSAKEETRADASEPDWQWLLEKRCARKGAVPSEEQHWLERYVRLGRGRARLRADPSAWNALDVLALAIETELDARGRFVLGREEALAARPDIVLRSGPRAYAIRRGEFALFDELHALWRHGPSKQRVPSDVLRRVEAEVETALTEARPRFSDALLR